jgi:hypothetical protein
MRGTDVDLHGMDKHATECSFVESAATGDVTVADSKHPTVKMNVVCQNNQNRSVIRVYAQNFYGRNLTVGDRHTSNIISGSTMERN